MKQPIAILLIVLGIGLGYFGFNKMNDSGGSVEIGNLEISAENSNSKNKAYILLGGGALSLVLGASMLMKSKSK